RRGNEITVIEAPSLPIGIIRNIEFFKAEKELQAGDIVLLLSDGATVGDCGWINDELLSWNTGSMNDLACHIVRLANLRAEENCRDDITAVAVKIK
ncbi:MAG: SpoIIE family protein phosphatase, partial [Clostridia bacterium]|nr:SpoIIE family protein phosphatase [Clostridia bacterium]